MRPGQLPGSWYSCGNPAVQRLPRVCKETDTRSRGGPGKSRRLSRGGPGDLTFPPLFLFLALNAQAALSQAREHQLASAAEPATGSRPTSQPPVPRPEHCEGAAAGLKAAQGLPPPAAPPNADVVASTQTALLQKLTWASVELGSSTSLETSIQLCGLIRACADALSSLKQLQQ